MAVNSITSGTLRLTDTGQMVNFGPTYRTDRRKLSTLEDLRDRCCFHHHLLVDQHGNHWVRHTTNSIKRGEKHHILTNNCTHVRVVEHARCKGFWVIDCTREECYARTYGDALGIECRHSVIVGLVDWYLTCLAQGSTAEDFEDVFTYKCESAAYRLAYGHLGVKEETMDIACRVKSLAGVYVERGALDEIGRTMGDVKMDEIREEAVAEAKAAIRKASGTFDGGRWTLGGDVCDFSGIVTFGDSPRFSHKFSDFSAEPELSYPKTSFRMMADGTVCEFDKDRECWTPSFPVESLEWNDGVGGMRPTASYTDDARWPGAERMEPPYGDIYECSVRVRYDWHPIKVYSTDPSKTVFGE